MLANPKQFILNNHNEFKKIAGENKLLDEVLEEYKNSYEDACKEKQEQYNALSKLSDYISIIALDKSNEDQLHDLKYDQNNILNEMVRIEREINACTPVKK